MAKLTGKQVNSIEMIALYYGLAVSELSANGVTEKYREYTWMVVYHRDEIGLKVPLYLREIANQYWEKRQKAAA
jgi:hypothetical protein